MGRAPCCEKVGLKRGRWTAEEDEILVKYIQANGEGSWRSLPKNAGLLRCGKSCRLRWINYLRADLKRGNISGEEEEVIIKLHGSYGNRWSLIASHIPGRTDNEIKNYWNSHLSRRIHTFKKADNEAVTVVMDMGRPAGGRKRRGGRTSRSAMKKNSGVPSNNVQHMIRKDKQQQDPPNFPVEASVVSDKSGGAYDSSVWISPSGMRMTEGRSESPFSDISYEAFESESLLFGLASSTELESEITVSPAMAVDGNCSTNSTTAGSGIDGVVSLTGGERQSTATTTHEDDHQWLYSALEDDEWINMDWDWNQGVADDKTVPREEEGWERWSWLWDTVDDNLQDTTKESELEKSYAAWLLSSDVNRS